MFFLRTHAPFHVADMLETCTDDVDEHNNVQVLVWGGYVWNVYGGYVDEHNNVQVLVWGGIYLERVRRIC